MSPTELVQTFVRAWVGRKFDKEGDLPFSLDGESVSADEVSSPASLLPVLAWHASRVFESAGFKGGMRLAYPSKPDSLLGCTVSFDKFDRSAAEMLLYVTEALEDAHANLPRCANRAKAADLRLLTEMFTAEVISMPAPTQAAA